jgi:hypothetical protein
LESLRGKDHLNDQGICNRNVGYLREIVLEGLDQINLSQDRKCWPVLVNMIMNIQVSEEVGKFLTI